jgi:hypothetical protein
MQRFRRPGGSGDVSGQLGIDWGTPAKQPGSSPPVSSDPAEESPPLVQRLPWDFKTTFPQPTNEAIDAGIINDEDTTPENVAAIHDEHARELLVVLRDQDAVLDARRRGLDPTTGKAPQTDAGRQRLAKLFEIDPERLECWWRMQMEVYESAFGPEAADAFGKAIRAWHAGVEVVAENPANDTTRKPTKIPGNCRRITARLPVPKPLAAAIAAGRFGQEENGRNVRPGPHEVRAITEQHAEKLIDLLTGMYAGSHPQTDEPSPGLLERFQSGIAAYADDFGEPAARQLDAYVRRQVQLGEKAFIRPKWRRS